MTWLHHHLRARISALTTERDQALVALREAVAETERERAARKAAHANVQRLRRELEAHRAWVRRLAGLALAGGADACVRLVRAIATSAELAATLAREVA